MTHALALPAGTELVGDYRIERVLGAGGFGITYLAEELALARDVTIKEYFPGDFAARTDGRDAVPKSQDCAGDYQWGLDRFIEEAQTLARFDHRNIVRVYRYFRANNTGYMVLHFEEGQSLKSWLKSLGRSVRQKEIDRILAPLLDALELIHGANFLHRDIAPDNIIIRRDGTPVLIDFGAARGEIAQQSRTLSALVKPGYSPYEQYAETGKQQGPWSDIYALGATLYHAITGKRPPDAPSRVIKDELVPAREAALSSYRPSFLAAIDHALLLDIDKRPQSVGEWRKELLAPQPKSGWLKRTMERTARSPANAPEQAPTPDPVPAAAAVPPPPDAPAPQGRLLDYIDQLRQKPQSQSQRMPGPSAGRRTQNAEPAKPQAAVPVPAAVPAKPVARRALRRKGERSRWARGAGRWRPLVLKLIIGAAIATAAVSFQDQLARLDLAPSQPASAPAKAPEVRREAREALREARESGREMHYGNGSGTEIRAHAGGVTRLGWSDDGRQLVTTGADASIKSWDTGTGALSRSLEAAQGPAAAFDVLGRRVLTGHGDGRVVLWDVEQGEMVGSYRRSHAAISAVSFAGDQSRFVAASLDHVIALWDTRSSSAPLFTYEGHAGTIEALAYSSRGALVVSAGADRRIRLWDGGSTDPLRVYRGHRSGVTVLAFSPDGRLFASGGADGSIRIWSAGSHKLQRSFTGHRGPVRDLAFAPSGEQLASVGDDGVLRIWDFRRARLLRSHSQGGSGLSAVSYAPDGRRIAVAGKDGFVRIVDAGRLPPVPW
jgi:serine/threonine protein kinase